MQSPITERPYLKVCINTVQKHFCPFKPTEYILGQVYYIHLIIKLKIPKSHKGNQTSH